MKSQIKQILTDFHEDMDNCERGTPYRELAEDKYTDKILEVVGKEIKEELKGDIKAAEANIKDHKADSNKAYFQGIKIEAERILEILK